MGYGGGGGHLCRPECAWLCEALSFTSVSEREDQGGLSPQWLSCQARTVSNLST